MASSVDDIRRWGKDNGWDVEDGGRLPSGLRAAYDNRDAVDTFVTESSPEYDATQWGMPAVDDSDIEEIAPVIREAKKSDRARSFLDRVKQAAPATAKPRGRKPAKARVSVEKVISMGWRFLAQAAQPINLPVARVLDMQAPVAGMVLEESIRNTLVDRLLQPLARAESGGEKAFAMIGPPLLTAVITTRPELYPVLRPALRESLRLWIDVAGDKLDEIAKRDAKFQEEYGTRVDDMIDLIFAPPPGESE